MCIELKAADINYLIVAVVESHFAYYNEQFCALLAVELFFINCHVVLIALWLMQSQGISPSASLKRDRLVQRNAILRRTGFIEGSRIAPFLGLLLYKPPPPPSRVTFEY